MKWFYLLVYIILLSIYRIKCENRINKNKDKPIYYTLDVYDINNNIKRYQYTYNYTTNTFNEIDEIELLEGVQTSILCCDEDIDKSDDEKKTLLFWTAPYTKNYFMSAKFMSAFPIWANKQRKKNGDTYCLKLYDAGWYDNVNAKICNDDPSVPCPDIIMMGTTQLAYRYNNREIVNLNNYYRKYFKETGKSVESMIIKYSYYDYYLDSNWLAVPVIVDFRIFQVNTTTFDNCKKQGYKLEYPPPLSDNWGSNYMKTWTWEKVVEYSKLITECTNKPGFSIAKNNSYEDIKLFIIICQSLGIPLLTEDAELNIKKCGFRDDKYIDKLSILKELFENKYISSWLVEEQVKDWQSKEYPKSFDEQPKFRLNNKKDDDILVNGLYFTPPGIKEISPELKVIYMPGASSFLGGAGLIITKGSKFPDEAFEYIEVLIDEKYPFFSSINAAVTPFENIHGRDCLKKQQTKKELCNSLLELNGTYPYYYIYKNTTNVIYITHTDLGSDRGIIINTDYSKNFGLFNTIFQNKNLKCDDSANYEKSTITYNDNYKIEIPINDEQMIILKSTMDISNKLEQKNEEICSIYDETLKIARPYQFPYGNMADINEFEDRSPISILLAHLYYKHNKTSEFTFKDIVNECCDMIDDIFLQECSQVSKIKINITECNESNQELEISYINCKNDNNLFPITAECPYIPYKNYKGIGIIITIAIGLIIQTALLIFTILKRKEKCIYMSGLHFSIFLIISSIVLNISVYYWIGKVNKSKCIIKIWTLICGLTGFICTHSIKADIILSIYKNKDITKKTSKFTSYIIYSMIGLVQIILLFIWSFTQKGVINAKHYITNDIYYDFENCSRGSEIILSIIFGIDYLLLFYSIFMAYRGRNLPDEFNESKKIFITSLASLLLITLCFISIMSDLDNTIPYFYISLITVILSLVIVLLFVGSKILIAYDIDFLSSTTNSSIIVVVNTQTHNQNDAEKTCSNYNTASK